MPKYKLTWEDRSKSHVYKGKLCLMMEVLSGESSHVWHVVSIGKSPASTLEERKMEAEKLVERVLTIHSCSTQFFDLGYHRVCPRQNEAKS